MTSAKAQFKTVPEICNALKAQLQAVQLPDAFLNGGPAQPAFQRIELFDNENLTLAFKTLLVSEQRICLIVPLTPRWEDKANENPRVTRRVLPVALLISDRVIGDRNAALFGGDKNPGAYALSALALPVVTGQLISNPAGVVSMPANESIIIIKKEERENLPGRAAIALELECRGGWLSALLDVSPTL